MSRGTKAGGGDDGDGALGRESEKRGEREKREREEDESSHRFKLSTSRANRTGVTGGHTTKGSWANSHATVGGVTQSRQTNWRDSRRHGATSPAGHAPAPCIAPVHMA
jgi:hypothetical protein